MGKRADSKILHRLDEAHVLIFKAHAGMGAVILEGHEIDAIVRYIEALEQEAARRTTPDRESIIEECAKVCDDHAKTSYLTEAATCARKIRALKTAPTSDQGEKS
ncbi:hypothetical protein [Burkholderia multivorans]|uniref:hypothetical protein n=1 Tax=Burkholderia multivorans TaxID=87883 RepID=UPI001588F616|nr:hypothetical protein [Burkholderia multivorans]MDR9240768.1 hypothetical protein [Burkholderia multivorans]MDR9266441.1 hypothetical protein [Burkholderia multivorans]MDR9287340.1 hypothetical protein [Burkholderia multivorans]MDR9289964.1 hypothetical protein [Burkholderia multivorans]MDR9312665.1 hypothetical protein [Burkholderia multivorans]